MDLYLPPALPGPPQVYKTASMFWMPFFRVTVELGQPVQEPTSFSFTVPSSKPLNMTSPPSS